MDAFVTKTKRKSPVCSTDPGIHASKKLCQREDDVDDTSKNMELKSPLSWKNLREDNLNCDYCVLLEKKNADYLFRKLEEELVYNTGDLAKVRIYGKWIDIPRKQVAYGDKGLSYTFSGNNVPALQWPPTVERIRDTIAELTGHTFNFVLVNRYKDGDDHMGEHRDDEKELVAESPIASLSLGQKRDFIFKHCEARGKNATRKMDPIKIELEHGSLLMMNYPTNQYWYHSLPKRKRVPGVRINLTFRHFKEPGIVKDKK